jgi:hypothetical protein
MEMNKFLETIASVNSAWTIAAFTIASIIGVLDRTILASRRRRSLSGPPMLLVWAAVIAIFLLGLMPIVADVYVKHKQIQSFTVYRIRVMVLDSAGVPVTGATLRASAPNETTTTAQGIGEVAIPRASMPADGKVTIFADLDAAFAHGRADLQLANDPNPSLDIRLEASPNAVVTGSIEDDTGVAVPDAKVSVTGGEQGVSTSSGAFALKTNAPAGKLVRLHAQKDGYIAVDQYHPAGGDPVTIVLVRRPARTRKKIN